GGGSAWGGRGGCGGRGAGGGGGAGGVFSGTLTGGGGSASGASPLWTYRSTGPTLTQSPWRTNDWVTGCPLSSTGRLGASLRRRTPSAARVIRAMTGGRVAPGRGRSQPGTPPMRNSPPVTSARGGRGGGAARLRG